MKELRDLVSAWRVQSVDDMTSDPGYATALRRCAEELEGALTRFGDDVVRRLFDLGNGQPTPDFVGELPPLKWSSALTGDRRLREYLWSDKDGDVWRWDHDAGEWTYSERGRAARTGYPNEQCAPYNRIGENRG